MPTPYCWLTGASMFIFKFMVIGMDDGEDSAIIWMLSVEEPELTTFSAIKELEAVAEVNDDDDDGGMFATKVKCPNVLILVPKNYVPH